MYKKTLIALLLSQALYGASFAAEFPSGMSDSTVEMIEAAQPNNPDNSANKPVLASTQKSASDLADMFLDVRGLTTGWNPEQETFYAKGVARFKVDADPVKLAQMREIKYTEAVLNARREIIEFIRTDLSVDNVLSLPNTGLETELDRQVKELQRNLDRAQKEYEEALAEYDQAKADDFGGISLDEFFSEGIASVINRFQAHVDTAKLKENQKQRIKEAKDKLLSLQATMDSLKDNIEAARRSVAQETVSSVSTFASMPLAGSVVTYQSESLIDSGYEIAVVVTWSVKQENFLSSVFAGQPIQAINPGKQSLTEYIRSNDWSTAVGNRLFADNNGTLHVLGIASWPVTGKGGAALRVAEGQARLRAMSQIALAIRGHIEAQSQAQARASERNDETTEVVSNFAETLTEKLQNIPLQGASKRFGKELTHPISGQKIYVAIYDYSPKNAATAKQMERANYDAAVRQEKAGQYSQGVKSGLENKLSNQQKDKSAFAQGQIDGQRQSTPAGNSSTSSKMYPEGQPTTGNQNSSSGIQEGSFGGTGTTDFRF